MPPRYKNCCKLNIVKLGTKFKLHGLIYEKASAVIVESIRNDKLIKSVKCVNRNGHSLYVPIDTHITLVE